GLFHMARNAEDLGALVLWPTDGGEPGRAAPQNGRHHGDALDIVDRRRTAIKPDPSGKGRLQPRLALPAFEGFEQRHFLAADISARATMEIKLEIVARAAGILADEAGGVGFLDRLLQDERFGMKLAADIDVARGRAHAGARQQAALDQLVRIVADDVAVLAGARLAFIGIDDEIARPVAGLRHERPFEAGRKSRTAAAAEP